MQNKIAAIIFILSCSFQLSSCKKYLDQVPDSVNFTEDQIFTDLTQSQRFIDQLYVRGAYFDDNNIINTTNPNYNDYYGKSVYGTREKLSDNTIPGLNVDWISGNGNRKGNNYYNSGDPVYWNEGDYRRFSTFFRAIRVANLSIRNIDQLTVATQEQKDAILGQAYFLRGHFYFELLQRWGGMPWIDYPLDPAQDMDLPRDSYTVTAQKIATSFDSAALYLPMVVEDAVWGKPSKVAALAYKAKALLWAASPFSNPGGDKKLWQDAAIAAGQALSVAEGSGYYRLVNLANWKNMFVDVNEEALHEVLFGRMWNQNFDFGPYYTRPRSVAFGSNTAGAESPTENLAESFQWSNGEPVDPNSAEYRSTPFTGNGINHTGRDPRFALTFMYNGHVNPTIQRSGRAVEIWNESYNNVPAQECQSNALNAGWTVTGYYNYKLYSDAMFLRGSSYVMWNIIRLADLYLFYAEAANRAWGPTAVPTGINGFTLTAVGALNKVRARANMPLYDNSKPWLMIGSESNFEQVVRNESRVETCLEDKRFYDLRRWKLLTDLNTTTLKALYIRRTAANTFEYRQVLMPDNQQLKYLDRHYLFPINPSNTFLGPNFNQNPGW
ncbi:RagB/SusD family nutrient uptake outer membrane protein [Flavitalea antarctica]